jgi:tetratricopeptide (TPR) repeat protein
LPRWVADDLARVTPKTKLMQATEMLTAAAEAFAGGKHGRAVRLAEQAKEASPRDATIREVIGLSAYRLGRWKQALAELRTFRRYTGETTHLAVEMDVLRALDRPDDVDKAWQLMVRLGGGRNARNEAKVVYASHLLDRGELRKAWEVAQPIRITDQARESERRVWYVAAKVAARLGDLEAARRLLQALQDSDPAFPGLDELDRLIGG